MPKRIQTSEFIRRWSKDLEGIMIYNEKYKLWLNKDGTCFKQVNGILQPCGYHNNSGYVMCKGKLLHRIMWETFIGEIPDGYEIDHIDANKENNSLSNLQLLKHSDNIKKTYNQGRKPVDNFNKIWSEFGVGFNKHYGKNRNTAFKLYVYEKSFYHTHNKKYHWEFDLKSLKPKFLETIKKLEIMYGVQ